MPSATPSWPGASEPPWRRRKAYAPELEAAIARLMALRPRATDSQSPTIGPIADAAEHLGNVLPSLGRVVSDRGDVCDQGADGLLQRFELADDRGQRRAVGRHRRGVARERAHVVRVLRFDVGEAVLEIFQWAR